MSFVSSLLQPIPGDSPCGQDMSYSAQLDQIAEARRYDDPTLDQGEWVIAIKEADWPAVAKSCAQLIEKTSKDFRLAVWLTEARAKVAGFKGLGEGYRLIASLCDQYWDAMYPLAEDGDQERRIGNLAWLLKRSTQLVREIPLTEGRETAFSLADFDAARARAAQGDKQSSDSGRASELPKLAVMELARKKSTRVFYETLVADAQYCLESLAQLEASVDARLGVDGPGFSSAREALKSVIVTIHRFAAEAGVGVSGASASESSGAADGQSGTADVRPAAFSGAIQTRAQALSQLRLVAEFFRRTEPHSPVAYLADKAASWGDVPLHTWLRSVIKDGASLAHLEDLLGLQQPNE